MHITLDISIGQILTWITVVGAIDSPSFDWQEFAEHFTVWVTLLGLGLTMLRKIGRLEQIFQDFPPHRHDNGNIVFPRGMKPEGPQRGEEADE